MSAASTDGGPIRSILDLGSLSRTQGGVTATGMGMVVTYLLPWVDIVGPTRAGIQSGTITGRDLPILPEAIAFLGVGAFIVTILRWDLIGRVVVLMAGILATGLALYLFFFLRSNEALITVGGYTGPPTSFEPAIGLFVALVFSVLLVGVAFVGILLTIEPEIADH